jgi:hypothetical protein
VSNATLTAAQTKTLLACYSARLWGWDPNGPQPSRPCSSRDTHAIAGQSRQMKALHAAGFVRFQETTRHAGRGTMYVVTMTDAGVEAARAVLAAQVAA